MVIPVIQQNRSEHRDAWQSEDFFASVLHAPDARRCRVVETAEVRFGVFDVSIEYSQYLRRVPGRRKIEPCIGDIELIQLSHFRDAARYGGDVKRQLTERHRLSM